MRGNLPIGGFSLTSYPGDNSKMFCSPSPFCLGEGNLQDEYGESSISKREGGGLFAANPPPPPPTQNIKHQPPLLEGDCRYLRALATTKTSKVSDPFYLDYQLRFPDRLLGIVLMLLCISTVWTLEESGTFQKLVLRIEKKVSQTEFRWMTL